MRYTDITRVNNGTVKDILSFLFFVVLVPTSFAHILNLIQKWQWRRPKGKTVERYLRALSVSERVKQQQGGNAGHTVNQDGGGRKQQEVEGKSNLFQHDPSDKWKRQL